MSENIPAPLTAAEADLRGMQFMPLFGDRLFTSTTWIGASPEARCAALRLWWRAFAHEVPAGSLPDDDKLLAEYAGYGVATKAWLKIKPQTMRGWVKCADGRLYHEFLAEVVRTQWQRRLEFDAKREKWREKKRRRAVVSPGNSPDTSPGNGAAFPGEVPRENALRGEGEGKYPPPPKKNLRSQGTNPRALYGKASKPDDLAGFGKNTPPAGMRDASFDERDAWLREQDQGDLVSQYGHWRYPKWVPANWRRKAQG